MIIGIFCRPNHPAGYGGTPTEKTVFGAPLDGRMQGTFGAHGYITWIVEANNWLEMYAVIDKLKVGSKWDTRNDAWYSGPLECVAVFEGSMREETKLLGPSMYKWDSNKEWLSIGDNRAVAWRKASDVLKD